MNNNTYYKTKLKLGRVLTRLAFCVMKTSVISGVVAYVYSNGKGRPPACYPRFKTSVYPVDVLGILKQQIRAGSENRSSTVRRLVTTSFPFVYSSDIPPLVLILCYKISPLCHNSWASGLGRKAQLFGRSI